MLGLGRVFSEGTQLNFCSNGLGVATRRHIQRFKANLPMDIDGDIFEQNFFSEEPPGNQGLLPPASQVDIKRGKTGMTLVAIEDNSSPTSALSVFVKAGSRYERGCALGSSHFLKRLAFSNTFKKYYYPLVLDNDSVGNEYGCLNTRDYIGYYVHGIRNRSSIAAQTLGAAVEPQLEEHEILVARAFVESEAEEASFDPKNILVNAIHELAFRDQSLAQSHIASIQQAHCVDNFVLRHYVNTHYLRERMIFVGNGYKMAEMEEFENEFVPTDLEGIMRGIASERIPLSSFHVLTPPEEISNPENRYVGGSEFRMPGNGNSHLILATQGVGAKDGLKAHVCINIAQFIIGGGMNSQNSVIPGLGFTSGLGRMVQSNSWINEASAFNFSYSDAGLFGIYFNSQAGHIPDLVDIFRQQYDALRNMNDEQVSIAKNQYMVHFIDRISSCPVAAAEFYTFQADNFGSAHTPHSYLQFVRSITRQDIMDTVVNTITSSKVTVAAIGDVKNLPIFN